MELIEYIKKIKDFRVGNRKIYPLCEIIIATIVGVMSGAKSWEDIRFKASLHLDELKKIFPYTHGLPSHDTFNRVFQLLEPKILDDIIHASTELIIRQSKLDLSEMMIHIDGKHMKGASKLSESTIHLLTAWVNNLNVSLGQVALENKTNEITALPLLLDAINLEGHLVTIDAMGTQENIAKQIIKNKGNYLLALKNNQKNTFNEAENLHNYPATDTFINPCNSTRGTVVEYTVSTYTVNESLCPHSFKKWKSLKTIVKIQKTTTYKTSKKVVEEIRWYLSSQEKPAKFYLDATISHWSIERTLHWHLDVTFGEDDSKKHAKNSAVNFSKILRIITQLGKNAPEVKGVNSLKNKIEYYAQTKDGLITFLSSGANGLGN